MTNEQPNALAIELQVALDQLEESLRRAAEATAALSRLAPRVAQIDSLIGQIESAIGNGRTAQPAAATSFAAQPPPPPPPVAYSRPTLVVPGALHMPNGDTSNGDTPSAPTADRDVSGDSDEAAAPTELPQIPNMQPASAAIGETLTSFRLAFESNPGPLDLRAVDDALSAHPAVRDVALLDYDGHKATLKVWITTAARPSDVEASLREQAPRLFSSDAAVSIVALTGVA